MIPDCWGIAGSTLHDVAKIRHSHLKKSNVFTCGCEAAAGEDYSIHPRRTCVPLAMINLHLSSETLPTYSTLY